MFRDSHTLTRYALDTSYRAATVMIGSPYTSGYSSSLVTDM